MAHILIIGSGTVGYATGRGFLKKGHQVSFYDTSSEVRHRLKVEGYETVEQVHAARNPDFMFIAVPTPTIEGAMDMRPLRQALSDSAKALASLFAEKKKSQAQEKKYPIVVIKSTVLPGTTTHMAKPILEQYAGKVVGQDFGLAVNPEYLREHFAFEDVLSSRLITIGVADARSARSLERLYADFETPIAQVSPEEAEFQKYVHNLWNATKISFFNEMREVGESLHCDTDKVFSLTTRSAEAFWNPFYGLRKRGPYGGSCLPKDTAAFLSWGRRTLHAPLPLLQSVIRVNEMLARKQRRREVQRKETERIRKQEERITRH